MVVLHPNPNFNSGVSEILGKKTATKSIKVLGREDRPEVVLTLRGYNDRAFIQVDTPERCSTGAPFPAHEGPARFDQEFQKCLGRGMSEMSVERGVEIVPGRFIG